jgi:hypothetical protein
MSSRYPNEPPRKSSNKLWGLPHPALWVVVFIIAAALIVTAIRYAQRHDVQDERVPQPPPAAPAAPTR